MTMLSNPEYGWCDFTLGNFKGTPSYLTNVPLDTLNAFIDYYCKGEGMATYDEEGTEFILVISFFSIYIISIKETDELYSFPDVRINDLAAEVIADIENNLDDWESFYCTNKGAQELKDRIQILKDYLSEE